MRILALILAGTAAMVAGCSPMTWHKNGVPQAAMYEDADECGRIAQRYALQYASGAGLGFARVQPYRDYRYGSGIWFDRPFDRQVTEAKVKQACMREKGYTLAPVEP